MLFKTALKFAFWTATKKRTRSIVYVCVLLFSLLSTGRRKILPTNNQIDVESAPGWERVHPDHKRAKTFSPLTQNVGLFFFFFKHSATVHTQLFDCRQESCRGYCVVSNWDVDRRTVVQHNSLLSSIILSKKNEHYNLHQARICCRGLQIVDVLVWGVVRCTWWQIASKLTDSKCLYFFFFLF